MSDKAQFSLITLGPDQEEFYEAFGHSAIRLVDPVLGIDYAYNYGVFSFNQPNFYLNFAKGHINYSLASSLIRNSERRIIIIIALSTNKH